MKEDFDKIILAKWESRVNQSWEKYTIPDDSTTVLELDAYGSYACEALGSDVFIQEYGSSAAAASADMDGYGFRLIEDYGPHIIKGQWGYSNTFYLATRARDATATLRLRKL